MQITVRLQGLLKGANEHGLIGRISKEAHLERHFVSALLHNKVHNISLSALSSLCDYLVQNHDVPASDLPGAIFGLAPSRFWSLLSPRSRLELCVGFRRVQDKTPLVMACDADLEGTVLHGYSFQIEPEKKRGLQNLEVRLVPAYAANDGGVSSKKAKSIYEAFARHGADCALVALGSNKVNPVVDCIVAEAFGLKPFRSRDHEKERGCPLFFRYRKEDPQPPSCCGGLQISHKHASVEPGIYYELPGGKWACAPWNAEAKDAALVFYRYVVPQERLEMVLAGFSGRATQALASLLRGAKSDEFWKERYVTAELQVGLFVVKFDFSRTKKADPGEPYEPPPTCEFVHVHKRVLAKYFVER